jgi:hypothetical protein
MRPLVCTIQIPLSCRPADRGRVDVRPRRVPPRHNLASRGVPRAADRAEGREQARRGVHRAADRGGRALKAYESRHASGSKSQKRRGVPCAAAGDRKAGQIPLDRQIGAGESSARRPLTSSAALPTGQNHQGRTACSQRGRRAGSRPSARQGRLWLGQRAPTPWLYATAIAAPSARSTPNIPQADLPRLCRDLHGMRVSGQ